MNKYKLVYYNSGGYRSSTIIETPYFIERGQEEDDKYEVMEGTKVIGGPTFLEKLLNDANGFDESNCIVEAILVKPESETDSE